MTELLSAQGVFDAEQMFVVATDTIDQASEVGSVLLLGTPLTGLAARVLMPTAPTTASNVVTVSIHGSLTEDGAIVSGSMYYKRDLPIALWTTPGLVEFIIPFALPLEGPWAVMTIAQSLGPDDITGMIAGIVVDHKNGDWSRVPGWNLTATIPA